MRMSQIFPVLLVAVVAVNDAVSAPTTDEWSKLTSRGLDQEAGTDIDSDRMLRARDERADETGEERVGPLEDLHLPKRFDPLLIFPHEVGASTSKRTLIHLIKTKAILLRQRIIDQHFRKTPIARNENGKKEARIFPIPN